MLLWALLVAALSTALRCRTSLASAEVVCCWLRQVRESAFTLGMQALLMLTQQSGDGRGGLQECWTPQLCTAATTGTQSGLGCVMLRSGCTSLANNTCSSAGVPSGMCGSEGARRGTTGCMHKC